METKYTDHEIAVFAQRMVDLWDQDEIKRFAISSLKDHYQTNQDYLQDDLAMFPILLEDK